MAGQKLRMEFTVLELDALGDMIMDRMQAYQEYAKEQPSELQRIRPFAELYAGIARKIYEAKREAGILEDTEEET
jgi:myo-inositol catabolism protein IolC